MKIHHYAKRLWGAGFMKQQRTMPEMFIQQSRAEQARLHMFFCLYCGETPPSLKLIPPKIGSSKFDSTY